MTIPDELFYVGQKAVIRKGNSVLILHDPDPAPGNIDLPGGKIQQGERDFPLALKREVFEETALTISVGKPFHISFWEFPIDSPHRNKGKKIFLVFYDCSYIGGEVSLSEEHDWYKWISEQEFKDGFSNKNNILETLGVYYKK